MEDKENCYKNFSALRIWGTDVYRDWCSTNRKMASSDNQGVLKQ